MISIKELTKQTGVSVRTMRYYDEINLLPPAGKTEGGHRLYSEKEIKKLQEIQFLKSLGFRLIEIKEMLSDKNWDWEIGLKNQLNYILQEKQRIIQIEKTLKGLLNTLKIENSVDLTYINKLIQLYQSKNEQQNIFRDKYFHQGERKLLNKLPKMDSDDPHSLEWISYLVDLKKFKHKGANSPEIQQIIHCMYEKAIDTFGENDDFFYKLWEIRKSPEKSTKMGFYPIEQDILNLIEEAWDFYENKRN